jgi:hypothetical protein
MISDMKNRPDEEFVKVVITVYAKMGYLGTRRLVKTLTDAEEIHRLMGFFPDAGVERFCRSVGGWKSLFYIEATKKSGGVLTLHVDHDVSVWSDDKGDWPIEKGFLEYMDGILDENMRVERM